VRWIALIDGAVDGAKHDRWTTVMWLRIGTSSVKKLDNLFMCWTSELLGSRNDYELDGS